MSTAAGSGTRGASFYATGPCSAARERQTQLKEAGASNIISTHSQPSRRSGLSNGSRTLVASQQRSQASRALSSSHRQAPTALPDLKSVAAGSSISNDTRRPSLFTPPASTIRAGTPRTSYSNGPRRTTNDAMQAGPPSHRSSHRGSHRNTVPGHDPHCSIHGSGGRALGSQRGHRGHHHHHPNGPCNHNNFGTRDELWPEGTQIDRQSYNTPNSHVEVVTKTYNSGWQDGGSRRGGGGHQCHHC